MTSPCPPEIPRHRKQCLSTRAQAPQPTSNHNTYESLRTVATTCGTSCQRCAGLCHSCQQRMLQWKMVLNKKALEFLRTNVLDRWYRGVAQIRGGQSKSHNTHSDSTYATLPGKGNDDWSLQEVDRHEGRDTAPPFPAGGKLGERYKGLAHTAVMCYPPTRTEWSTNHPTSAH